MKSNIYSITELENPTSVQGEGQKGLMIVLNENDKTENIQTLNGLLKAIHHDQNTDVTIVSKSSAPIDINTLIKKGNYTTLILLGISPSEVGYSLLAKKNFIYNMEGMSLLLAHSLSDMNKDKEKKMAFWKNLQGKFLSQ